MPEPRDPSRTSRPRWLPAPSPWLIVPAAVLAGLLLFVAVWLAQRPSPGDDGAAVLPAVSVDPDPGTPLPAPQPQDLEGTLPEAGESGVFVLPDAPAEPPRAIAGAPPAAADAGLDDASPSAATVVSDSQPVPVHSPQPAYPARALRRGTSGEVLVRALVGVDGRPRQVEVARSSSHRALDQAAVRAIRSWRFQPAMRAGEPVAQTVHVPVAFNP